MVGALVGAAAAGDGVRSRRSVLKRPSSTSWPRPLPQRHPRPWAGDPRLCSTVFLKAWMAGTRPAMTRCGVSPESAARNPASGG